MRKHKTGSGADPGTTKVRTRTPFKSPRSLRTPPRTSGRRSTCPSRLKARFLASGALAMAAAAAAARRSRAARDWGVSRTVVRPLGIPHWTLPPGDPSVGVLETPGTRRVAQRDLSSPPGPAMSPGSQASSALAARPSAFHSVSVRSSCSPVAMQWEGRKRKQ